MFGIIVWIILICIIALADEPGLIWLIIISFVVYFFLIDFNKDTIIYLKKQLRKHRKNRKL